MKRIFPDYTYGVGPRVACHWDKTVTLPEYPQLTGDIVADVCVIGSGFTGLNAALTLAKAGTDVVLLDAKQPGWGASGRNGGFCCLGGGKASDAFLDRNFGKTARMEWRQTEKDAVQYVSDQIQNAAWEVDRHSKGETILAHRPMSLDRIGQEITENYGVDPVVEDLSEFGRGFHAAVTVPLGFALNPRKLLAMLLMECKAEGVRVFGDSPATITKSRVESEQGGVDASRVIVATNGYSSEDVPPWLAGRFMPTQSNVLVTRPLTDAELRAQGWKSEQMCYDTRNLLHYFRLMPDRRFLFGMRGGLFSGHWAEAQARKALCRDFKRMFPEWANVEIQAMWSGLVALAKGKMPFVGPVDEQNRIYVSACYHGNGVAMGSFCGCLAAQMVLGDDQRPEVIRQPLQRFPLGLARRALMPPLYLALGLQDRLARRV